MKFTNLTDAQVRDIQAAITPLHDVVKEEAILKAFDILVGVVNGSSAAAVSDLADDVQTWGTTLVNKLNADFTAQNGLSDLPLTLDVNYAAPSLS